MADNNDEAATAHDTLDTTYTAEAPADSHNEEEDEGENATSSSARSASSTQGDHEAPEPEADADSTAVDTAAEIENDGEAAMEEREEDEDADATFVAERPADDTESARNENDATPNADNSPDVKSYGVAANEDEIEEEDEGEQQEESVGSRRVSRPVSGVESVRERSSSRPGSGRPTSGVVRRGSRPGSGALRRASRPTSEVQGNRSRSSRPGSAASLADPFAGMSLEEMENELQQQEHENALLIRETHCLERFWERQEHVFSENQGAMPQSALKEMGGGGRRRRSRPSRQLHANQIRTAPMELTDAQKGDIAQRDLEFMQTNYERFCEESDRAVYTLQALVSEAEQRLAELPKLQEELQKDVAEAARSTRSGKPEIESLQRFYENRISQCKSMIDKLEVKNSAMKSKQTREMAQLKSKEDIGGSLHKVDFDQLKIENTRYAEIMNERVRELLDLKVVVGGTNNNLNMLKKRLKQLEAEQEVLQKEIVQRKELLTRVNGEVERVEEQAGRMQETHAKLSKELADYRPPDVMELVKEQAALPDLRKTIKTMERKVELAQMELTRTQRTLRVTKRAPQN